MREMWRISPWGVSLDRVKLHRIPSKCRAREGAFIRACRLKLLTRTVRQEPVDSPLNDVIGIHIGSCSVVLRALEMVGDEIFKYYPFGKFGGN